MIRASMPRTSAADPTPLPAFAAPDRPVGTVWSLGRRIEMKGAFTLAEVVGRA